MPFRQYVLTLSGSAQQLSTVFAAAEKESNADGPAIIGLSLQPSSSNANPVYVGSSAVAANVHAVRLSSATSGVPPAPWLREYAGSLPIKLGDYYAIGTSGEKLHIGIDVE
jgi:hypothetical protein